MIEQVTLKELCELMKLENLMNKNDLNLKQEIKDQIMERLIKNKLKK